MKRALPKSWVLCVNNRGYRASLVVRRVYRSLPDPAAARRALVRVIDESGEDYLYPRNLFAAIQIPEAAGKAFARTA